MQRLVNLTFLESRERVVSLLTPDLAFLAPMIVDRKPTAYKNNWSSLSPEWISMTEEQLQRFEAWAAQYVTEEGTLVSMIAQQEVYAPEDLLTFPVLKISFGVDSEVDSRIENDEEARHAFWQCGNCNRETWNQTEDLVVSNLTLGVDFQTTYEEAWIVSRSAKRFLEQIGILTGKAPGLSIRPLANSAQFWQMIVNQTMPVALQPPIMVKDELGVGRLCPECGLPYRTDLQHSVRRVVGDNEEVGMLIHDPRPLLSIVHAGHEGDLPPIFRSEVQTEYNFAPNGTSHSKGDSCGDYGGISREYTGFYFVSQKFYQQLLAEGMTGLHFEPAAATDRLGLSEQFYT